MPSVTYQPNRLLYAMNTDTTDKIAIDEEFDLVWRQGILRPFDTETRLSGEIPYPVADYSGNEGSGAEPPWLRQFPPGDGFGRPICDAACWDKSTGFWYIVHRQGSTTRLLRTTELLDTDCTVIKENLASGERVKDLHVVTVQNSGLGYRKVLVLRLGRVSFPTNVADWGERLCWLEINGNNSLQQFATIPYPRQPAGSQAERQMLWSMCVGGIGATDEASGRIESEVLYGLIDSENYVAGEVASISQQITRWTWNRNQQTFAGGARGSTYQGVTFSQTNPNQFNTATYIKRISWNKFTNNGDGNVMFPLVRLEHPAGRGNGSYIQTESRVAAVLGTDNTFLVHVYKCPTGPLTVVDDEMDVVQQYVHPSQAWLGDDDDFLYISMEGSLATANRGHIGIFAYAPRSYPGNQNDSEPLQTAYRRQMTGRHVIAPAVEPWTRPPRLILGPGCY